MLCQGPSHPAAPPTPNTSHACSIKQTINPPKTTHQNSPNTHTRPPLVTGNCQASLQVITKPSYRELVLSPYRRYPPYWILWLARPLPGSNVNSSWLELSPLQWRRSAVGAEACIGGASKGVQHSPRTPLPSLSILEQPRRPAENSWILLLLLDPISI